MEYIGMIDTVVNTLVTGLWVLVGVVPLFFAWILLRYKHRIQVREIGSKGSKKFVHYDRFCVKKMRDGTIWWKLLKGRSLLPVAPNEVIDFTKRGKMHVTAYHTSDDQYIYSADDVVASESCLEDSQTKDADGKVVKAKVVKPIQPFNSNQRAMLIDQAMKAEEEKGIKWTQHIVPVAAIASVTIIVVMLILMWGDIVSPALHAGEMYAKFNDESLGRWESIIARLEVLIGGRQRIGESVGANLNATPPG